jgi:hypothetical protein
MVLTGIALEEDGVAPAGTEIRVLKGATECGTSEVIATGPRQHNYELMVLGAGERVGCPQPGDLVTIEMGSQAADEAIVYDPTPDSFTLQSLTALGDRAWFWAQELLLPDAEPSAGQIEAVVNGKLCGTSSVQTAQSFSQKVSGFTRLIVPGQSIEAGCGGPGDVVTFLLNGSTLATAVWNKGLIYTHLNLPGAIVSGDVNCTGSVDQEDLIFALKRLAALVSHSACSPFASDMNCDLAFNGNDILALLYWLTGLPLNQPDGCPEIGTA